MVVDIARTFQLSLDELILGDSAENNMTAKLIKDGSDTRRAKLNLSSIFIGAVLLLLGIGCIIIQAFSVEYIDAAGYLHENFSLLPIGFLLLFCGLLSFLIAEINCDRASYDHRKAENTEGHCGIARKYAAAPCGR